MGALALIISLCGVGFAAIQDSSGVLHACYAKSGGDVRLVKASKKCAKGEKATTWNQKGATGPAGQRGATGPLGVAGSNGANGIDGSAGQAGSAGPGLIFGRASVAQNAENFTSLAGSDFTGMGAQASADTPMPPGANLTARDFGVSLNSNVGGAGQTVVVALQVNGANALTCTINTGQSSCSSTQTVVLHPGDLVNFREQASATAGNSQALITFRIVF
jgi:hypothetical protein